MTGFGEFPLIRRHHNLLAAQGTPNITGPIQKGNGGGGKGGGSGPTAGKGHGKGNGAGGGGDGPYGSHSYWRVEVDNNFGNSTFTGFTEVEMATTPGGANVCSGGTASASAAEGTGPASEAFNGDTTSLGNGWFCTDGDTTQWIQYQFASPVAIEEVRLFVYNGTASLTGRQGRVLYSDDGVSFTEAFSYNMGPNADPSGAGVSYAFPETIAAGAARAWRILTSANNGGTTYTCYPEVEFRSVASGSSEVPVLSSNGDTAGGKLYYSTERSGPNAFEAFDGVKNDASSAFLADTTSTSHIGWGTTGDPYEVVEVMMNCGGSSNFPTRMPRTMKLQSSPDGITWTDVESYDETGWTLSEDRILTPL